VKYRIELRPAAGRDLAALPKKILRQIDAKIMLLGGNPRPPGSRKLEGSEDLFRIRSGDYRIIYQILDGSLLVVVIRVRHRRDVYRGI
jgi:mRNA interferase RelE/StbE